MSTRYVWGKYNTENAPSYIYENFWAYSFIHAGYQDGYDAYERTGGVVYYAPSFTVVDSSDEYFVKVKLTNPTTTKLASVSSMGAITVPAGNYYALSDTFYAATPLGAELISDQSNSEEDYDALLELTTTIIGYDEDGSDIYGNIYTIGRYAKEEIIVYSKNYVGDLNAMPHTSNGQYGVTYVATVTTGKGSFVSYASSSYQKYSSGVNSDGYYYSYIGTDNVDPTAVSITSSTLNAGSTATVAVTPKSTSYGTLRYTYEYSANNGTWTTITSYNTSTSYSFTIPNGTTTIQVRAKVSDNIGFYSSDYVTSSSYSVNSYTTYVSVSGAIKGVNPVVAYGGGTYSKSCCLQKRSYQDFVTSIFLVAIVTILQFIFYFKY